MKKVIALTVCALLASAAAAQSAPLAKFDATDFSSIKEVEPGKPGKFKTKKLKKKKHGGSSAAEKVGFNPQPDPPGIVRVDPTNPCKRGAAGCPSDPVGLPAIQRPQTRMDAPRVNMPAGLSGGGGRVR
jgi:hypothetical protein